MGCSAHMTTIGFWAELCGSTAEAYVQHRTLSTVACASGGGGLGFSHGFARVFSGKVGSDSGREGRCAANVGKRWIRWCGRRKLRDHSHEVHRRWHDHVSAAAAAGMVIARLPSPHVMHRQSATSPTVNYFFPPFLMLTTQPMTRLFDLPE